MAKRTVAEIMTTDVEILKRSDSLRRARDVMERMRIRHFPVVENGKVVGVVSHRDILKASLSSTLSYREEKENAFLDNLSLRGVVHEPAIMVGSDATIRDAARLMVDHKIGCLPVVDGDSLVGLVSETDILRLVAEGE
jgi:CBS domain-containing membrane protein